MGEELIRCHNRQKADIRFQDGGLPHVPGVKNIQVVRACRESDEEVYRWTYNHAPMLAYWRGRFFLEYLSDPVSEHVPPSKTLLVTSRDGIGWGKPEVVFPPLRVPFDPYSGPGRDRAEEKFKGKAWDCVMHQRMGFYVSGEDRLLVLGFYGFSPDPDTAPNHGYGLGRVVREIYEDGSFSPVCFLRRNDRSGYGGSAGAVFPDYRMSRDAGFRRACEELLDNRLIRQQWWEEERLDEEFFGSRGGKALSCYSLPDGRVMAVFKESMACLTDQNGNEWSQPVRCPTLETSTGKVWGQRTEDGRYALVYNPSTDGAHRWPLAVITGENGMDFDGLMAVTPEVSPCRYEGLLKNLGPQYVRGICEWNPKPEDTGMWLTYSVNKEDIWVCRVPVPVSGSLPKDVDEILTQETADQWNLYSPVWAKAVCVTHPEDGRPCIRMEDFDPYDRSRAMRIFQAGQRIGISACVRVDSAAEEAGLVLELQNDSGAAPVRVRFGGDGFIYVRSGGREDKFSGYTPGVWIELNLLADCVENRFEFSVGKALSECRECFHFSQSVCDISRALFTTKAALCRNSLEDSGRYKTLGDLPGDVRREKGAVCWIHRFRAVSREKRSD